MRYVKQRDKYSCGPIAIINLKKALGFKATYKHLKNTSYWCKCKKPNGTWPKDIDKYLRSLPQIVVVRKYHPTVKDIKEKLKDGPVILRYGYKRNGKPCGHYIVVTSYDGEYSVCNAGTRVKSLTKYNHQKLNGIIQESTGGLATIAWYIRRK